jgi:hypothetical protein
MHTLILYQSPRTASCARKEIFPRDILDSNRRAWERGRARHRRHARVCSKPDAGVIAALCACPSVSGNRSVSSCMRLSGR